MRKIVLLVFAVLSMCCQVAAQNRQVTGTVTDLAGNALVGVSVTVDGTTRGTSTDAAGKYSISAASDATLRFSFLGYETVAEAVGNKTVINVTMEDTATAIENVTVVAYGAKRKEDLVGSVSKVKSSVIANSNTSSVTKALEGAVAGMQVLSSTGQPGSDAAIYVRGIGSMSGNNTALVVVDGVPYNGSLSDINPADIESLVVSKDAVSNSLYGARAANGVVLVTTKTGRNSAPKISVKTSWGVNTRGIPDYNMADNSREFYELTWYGIRNTQVASGMGLAEASQYASDNLLGELSGYNAFIIPDGEALVGTDGKLNPNAKLRYDDSFADALFKNSLHQDYQVSASGGNDNSDYYISMSYLDDDSYVLASDYNRFTTRVNVNTRLKKWLKVGTNINYSRITNNGVMEDAGKASNAFSVARSWAPIFPVHGYDAQGNLKYDSKGNPLYDVGLGQTDGTSSRITATNQNVIASMKEDIRKTNRNNITTRSYVTVDFLKHFTATANYAYDYRASRGLTYYTPTVGDGQSFNGRGTKSAGFASVTNFNQLLSYDNQWGKHTLNLMAGHEYYKYIYDSQSGQKTNFFDLTNPQPDNGGPIQYFTGSNYSHVMEGYFLKGDYNYANKYYLSANVRRDGTSRFHPDHRWGTFWSVGGSWRIAQEKFMESAEWVNELKLRASYGTQGNENVLSSTSYNSFVLYQDQYGVSWDGTSLSTSTIFYGNPDLTWENQKTVDVGLDFRLWNKFYGTIDYFNRKTDDMLFKKTLAISGGRPYNWENVGAMRNSGIEIELNYDVVNRRDVRWTLTLLGSHYENKILRLPEENRVDGIINGTQKFVEGSDRYRWFIQRYAGMTEEGKPTWYKQETVMGNDGKPVLDKYGKEVKKDVVTEDYNEASRYLLDKSALADFTGGFNTSLYVKGFDLSIQTSFQIGGYIYDSEYTGSMSSSYYVGHHKDLWKTWNPETQSGKYPIWNSNANSSGMTATSDLWLTDASYFNIRNITLGYTLPAKFMKKLGIDGIRIYVSADNVAMFSKRKGLDPRITLSGDIRNYGGYGQIRTITGGINFNF